MRGNRPTPSHDYACYTCHSLSSSELVKIFGLGCLKEVVVAQGSGPRAKTLKCVGKKNTGAKQTQKCCNRLNHRSNPSRPCGNRTTRHRAQSKGFRAGTEDPAGVMLWHNSFAGEGGRHDGAAQQPIIHYAGALPISAVFRMRYLHILVRRWAASGRMTGVRCQVGARPAEWYWGAWGFDSQIRRQG